MIEDDRPTRKKSFHREGAENAEFIVIPSPSTWLRTGIASNLILVAHWTRFLTEPVFAKAKDSE